MAAGAAAGFAVLIFAALHAATTRACGTAHGRLSRLTDALPERRCSRAPLSVRLFHRQDAEPSDAAAARIGVLNLLRPAYAATRGATSTSSLGGWQD